MLEDILSFGALREIVAAPVPTEGGIVPLEKTIVPRHTGIAEAGADSDLLLNVFQHIVKLLKGTGRQELPAELILEELAVRLPHETPRQMFTTLLNWGRYGDVFGYSRDTDLFFLHREESPPTA